jgi:Protein tyrosine and serine/threonine kinase
VLQATVIWERAPRAPRSGNFSWRHCVPDQGHRLSLAVLAFCFFWGTFLTDRRLCGSGTVYNNMDVVQSAASLAGLVLAVVTIAQSVQQYKHFSKRLGQRVNMLQGPVLQKASYSTHAETMARELLSEIEAFLLKLKIKKPLRKMLHHKEISQQFVDFGSRLSELMVDLDFCYVEPQVVLAENVEDARDDFEYAQILNKQLLPVADAVVTNKQLQLEASAAKLTGFLEIDFNLLPQGQQLGQGSFGIVFKSSWSGMPVAVKVANTSAIDAATIKELRNELRIHAMQEMKHERIIAFYAGELFVYMTAIHALTLYCRMCQCLHALDCDSSCITHLKLLFIMHHDCALPCGVLHFAT